MVNTGDQAIAAAAAQSSKGPQFGVGLCLQRVRLCYGVDAKYPDAATAWANSIQHTTGLAPKGTPVWWTGGSEGHGHIAISTGDGWCWSTDILRSGYFDLVPITDIAAKWGMRYVGWSEDLNDVRVWTAPPAPVVRDTRGKHVDWALVHLSRTTAAEGSPRARQIKAAKDALRVIKAWTTTAGWTDPTTHTPLSVGSRGPEVDAALAHIRRALLLATGSRRTQLRAARDALLLLSVN